jgi:type IV pilus assembly protein PilE
MQTVKPGFSLIELLIVLAIVGILAAICYPSYQQYVLRSYRAEAISQLLLLANAQEQHLADYGVYSADLVALGVKASERYTFNINLFAAQQEFELTAHAQGQQQADSECQLFTLNHLGQRNGQDLQAQACWN